MALARAHDIPVPTPHTLDNMPTILQAVRYHPKFTTDPLLHLFLIPQNEKEPLKQVEVVRDSTVMEKISKLLGCELSCSVLLHSEDQVAYVRVSLFLLYAAHLQLPPIAGQRKTRWRRHWENAYIV